MGKIKKIKQDRKRAEVESQLAKMKRNRLIVRSSLLIVCTFIIVGAGSFGYKYANRRWNVGGKVANNWERTKEMFKKDDNTKETATAERKNYTEAPKMQIDASKQYIAQVETNKGNFTITLNASDVPNTVNNFVVLSRDGFYNGTIFHRIIKDFMIQGGDPDGNGTGGPGYKFDDEEFDADYTPGTVAMANSGENTNGSQFFVMTHDYSGGKLPKNYTIFGKVTAGMDTIERIAVTPVTQSDSGEQSKPTEEVKIAKITIEEK